MQTGARPLIFGEVLFDQFEDGNQVLGGAPFNVAWHLQGFGYEPLFVSRVGNDDPGRFVLDTMQQWGMDSRGVQTDAKRSTGLVKVRFSGRSPGYEIVKDSAYDFIDAETALAAVANLPVSLIYHGTLATRSNISLYALTRLRQVLKAPVFVDVNLRTPWWSQELVAQLLTGANWLKLNDEEIMVLRNLPQGDTGTYLRSAQTLRGEYGLQAMVLTRGEEGAMILDDDGVSSIQSMPVMDLVDTVGAGDAFAAVTIIALLERWDNATCLARASEFAAEVCRQRGALVTDPELYQSMSDKWRDD